MEGGRNKQRYRDERGPDAQQVAILQSDIVTTVVADLAAPQTPNPTRNPNRPRRRRRRTKRKP
jgi:hypothetical protein